ncbi:membrane or secreted protein [Muricauda brasiliensis]|uniref:membrane or secreted protein n=1 Tax=Muricauda brasiliensis TaxID=2162892 RepID=UPI000D3BF502|nr:membrane or secreted protein [Muricauda brasiliensis]
MKKVMLLVLCSLTGSILAAQDLLGAWTYTESSDDGQKVEHILILTGDFFSEAFFEKADGKFLGTKGGSYAATDENIEFTYEFSTQHPETVGEMESKVYKLGDVNLQLDGTTWTHVDDGTPGDLFGAWLISGRKRDGEIVKRDTSGPRKTMKILSGTRFQWIAYNTETKEFMGTGGGTYTTIDGKYIENIGFFSRDDSRVGASLEFNYELKEGDWHHSGLSSKGDPIYEVWSKRKL